MEENTSDGMCRCCATEGSFKDFQTTYHWMGVEEIYSDMLKDCFNISLTSSEAINNGGICEVCVTQLRNAFNFKRQVQLTEEQFKKKVRESVFKSGTIKLEMSQDDVESDNVASDNLSDADYEVPIKEEKLEDKPKKRQAKASSSKAKKPKTEGETSKRARDTISVFFEDSKIIPKIEEDDNEDIIYEKGVELQMHRTNIHQILMNSNATPIRCHKGIGYACSFCIKQFPDPGDLKKHTLESHKGKCMFKFMNGTDLYKFYVKLDITMLKCSLCDTYVDNIDKIIIHLKEIHNKKMYTRIKNQILPFKFETETLQCFICKMLYHKFKSLLEHMHTHYRNYNCDECDAGFVNRMILAQHAKCHKLGSFKCDHCSKEFDTLRKKRSHEKCVHTHSVTLYKCGYCNKKFKDYRIKVKHISQEHGVSDSGLKCQACDRMFSSQREYNVHVKRQHLMDKRFKCAECDMAFFTSSELSNHSVKHTGLRKFVCEICHKAYGRRKTLREHLRIHTDDRRFKCEHCSQTFVQKCSWRGHMRAKHGQIV